MHLTRVIHFVTRFESSHSVKSATRIITSSFQYEIGFIDSAMPSLYFDCDLSAVYSMYSRCAVGVTAIKMPTVLLSHTERFQDVVSRTKHLWKI